MAGGTLPIEARSISGVGRGAACELFRAAGWDTTLAAHLSEDGSVFVQRIEVWRRTFVPESQGTGMLSNHAQAAFAAPAQGTPCARSEKGKETSG